MNIQSLKDTLLLILEDEKVTTAEKHQLQALVETLSQDKIAYLRNQAFAIAREHMRADANQCLHILKWLEKLVKAIDNAVEPPRVGSAYFSPGEDCRNKLLDLMQIAKTQLDICVFTISDNTLAKAILKAHNRGVNVRIITDNDKSHDKGSDVHCMLDKGLAVRMDKTENHMHHKFMVVDQHILVNGSFNWTRSATDRNEENLQVSYEPAVVNAFQEKFNALWQRFE